MWSISYKSLESGIRGSTANYNGYKELKDYIQARLLRIVASELVKKFSGNEKILLTAKIVNSSRSVTRNPAEGYGRFTFTDTRNFL